LQIQRINKEKYLREPGIANYLIKNNWKNNNLGAIYSYNHSLNYVMGVKAYAEKLKNNQGLNF